MIFSIIKQSRHFDAEYYLKDNKEVDSALISALDHYCKIGIYEDRKPNEHFDPIWYKEHYEDVKADVAPAIVHYILFGEKENRFINAPEKKEYEEELEKGFDVEFYKNNNEDLLSIENENFDFLLHYIRYGKNENRQIKYNELPNFVEKEIETIELSSENNTTLQEKAINPELEALYEIIAQEQLDFSKYIEKHNLSNNEDPILHYLMYWNENHLIIENYFDSDLYLSQYHDVKDCKVNPLIHFITSGNVEGRIGTLNNFIHKGDRSFVKNRETIVFVSHESSATGAPLLGYNIVDSLSESYNVIHIVMKEKSLHKDFYHNCFLLVDGLESNIELKSEQILQNLHEEYTIACVVLNSVETFPILHTASNLLLPTLSLIHEFSDYVRPIGKMVNTLFYATKIIVPADIIKHSILKDLTKLTGIQNEPTHILKHPQGKLPYIPETYGENDSIKRLLQKFNITNKEETKVIIGSGYVQIRKGVDLFLSVARYLKNIYDGELRFIWVGDGYDPEYDLGYSTWLTRDIEFYGLQDDFFFLDHQKNLDTVFELADIFCLTSRMDPFPNVAIDAMEQNVPIACFKNTSGTEEFLKENKADSILADYLDSYGLAAKMSAYLKENPKKRDVNALLVKEKLDFKTYISFIESTMNSAIAEQKDSINKMSTILNKSNFDYKYHGLLDDSKQAAFHYVSLCKKRLYKMSPNPYPGFSHGKWMHNHPDSEIPLLDAVKLEQPYTHKCHIISDNATDKEVNFKYAVHLHLFYVGLTDEFVEYFSKLPGNFDLYITMIDASFKDEVKAAFESCGAQKVEVIIVENIGRDVAPLIFELKDILSQENYDIIGHFHSKKSLSTDEELGDRWRKYLMQNLIGSQGDVKNILAIFNDPTVGLLFAEDRHIVDIGENREFIDDLVNDLKLDTIDETSVIPLGNMYWARIDAIKEFFTLDKNKLLQEEPLPYDGSYMHAIERVIPNLVNKNGYKYVTVYKEGTKW